MAIPVGILIILIYMIMPALIGGFGDISGDGYKTCLCAGEGSEQDRSQMTEEEGQEPLPGQERDPNKKYHFFHSKDGKVRMGIYPDTEAKIGKLPLEKEIEERFSKTKSKDEAEKVSDELREKVEKETAKSIKSFKGQNDQVIDIITNCPELDRAEKQRKIDEFTDQKDKDLVLADEWASESKSSIEKKYVDTCKSFDKEEQSGDNDPSESTD